MPTKREHFPSFFEAIDFPEKREVMLFAATKRRDEQGGSIISAG
jgi:hypothetical protein